MSDDTDEARREEQAWFRCVQLTGHERPREGLRMNVIMQKAPTQISPAGSTRIATIAKSALIGGAIGAAGAAALSFTALPFVGALTAPIAAAIGGAAGLVIGGIVGFFRSRSAAPDARQGMALIPPPPVVVGPGGSMVPPPPPRV